MEPANYFTLSLKKIFICTSPTEFTLTAFQSFGIVFYLGEDDAYADFWGQTRCIMGDVKLVRYKQPIFCSASKLSGVLWRRGEAC